MEPVSPVGPTGMASGIALLESVIAGPSASIATIGRRATLNVTTSAAGAQPRNPCGVMAASHEPSCVRPETVTAVPVGKDARLSPPGEAASIAPPERTTATWPAPAAEPAPLGASAFICVVVAGVVVAGVAVATGVGDGVGVSVGSGVAVGVGRSMGASDPAPDGTRSPTMTGSCAAPNIRTSTVATQPEVSSAVRTAIQRPSAERPSAVRFSPTSSSRMSAPPGASSRLAPPLPTTARLPAA